MNKRKEEAIVAITNMYELRDVLRLAGRALRDRCRDDYNEEDSGIATTILLAAVGLEASVDRALGAIENM